MGLGWVLGFVAAFADWPALWYAFIVVNSSQGALLCAAFVVTRQVLRLLADDCVRPLLVLVGRRDSGTAAAVSTKAAGSSSQTHGDSTAITRMSLPAID